MGGRRRKKNDTCWTLSHDYHYWQLVFAERGYEIKIAKKVSPADNKISDFAFNNTIPYQNK